jgi:hypothetical protein
VLRRDACDRVKKFKFPSEGRNTSSSIKSVYDGYAPDDNMPPHTDVMCRKCRKSAVCLYTTTGEQKDISNDDVATPQQIATLLQCMCVDLVSISSLSHVDPLIVVGQPKELNGMTIHSRVHAREMDTYTQTRANPWLTMILVRSRQLLPLNPIATHLANKRSRGIFGSVLVGTFFFRFVSFLVVYCWLIILFVVYRLWQSSIEDNRYTTGCI